ncbi:MAG TPA: ribonuclease HI [Candidatus Kapabacteria bacterium]|nr:ribonuclease HI [Candidatus Kapabacteria bacterium]
MNSLPEIIVYTDGACSGNPGPGGYAWVVQIDGEEYECVDCANDTTNNQMELNAVVSALKFISEKYEKIDTPQKPKVKIYCDSKYICDAINNDWLKNWALNNWKKKDRTEVKNLVLWKEIYAYLQNIDVEFIWVEGHNGNELNEYCDSLARKAAQRIIEPHLIEKHNDNNATNESRIDNKYANSFKFIFNNDNSVQIIQNNNSIILNKANFNEFIKKFTDVIIKFNN